ncbi:MAG TPA: hypothetical protein VIG30_07000 [Ktedonobacterales bacterium]
MGRDEPELPNQWELPDVPGLPDLRGTPRGSADAAALGVPLPWAGLPSLTPADPGSAPLPALTNPPGTPVPRTLTQRMRSVQPPDVGRQVMSELGVLANELSSLPTELALAGLARAQMPAYFAAVQDYVELCRYAWEAVAEEQLEQVGAEPPYRQAAVAVARQVAQLRQACGQAFAPPRKPRLPLFWRRRIALVRQGLQAWREQLEPVPNPLPLGRALFDLQGAVGLASAGALELLLVDWLTSAAGAFLGLLSVGALLLLGTDIARGLPNQAVGDGVLAFIGLIGLMITLVLGIANPLPIGPLLGASVYGPASAACLGWQGSRPLAVILRVWWVLAGSVATLAVPLGMALGGVLVAQEVEPLRAPTSVVDALQLGGHLLVTSLELPAAFCLVALVALMLPFAVVALVRFAREMAGNPLWVPAARRYALLPALAMITFITAVLLVVAWSVGTALDWEHLVLLRIVVFGWNIIVSVRGILFALVLAMPYVLLVDLPYRLGIRRWRAQRLADLEHRRAELESQVRRLATQEANDQVLRAMQYDLVLLQFYRGQMDEARAASGAPFRIEGRIAAIIVAVVSALLLDGGGVFVAQMLAAR